MPHAASTNSELGRLDAIKASSIGTMVKPDKFVFDASGVGNNWTIEKELNYVIVHKVFKLHAQD